MLTYARRENIHEDSIMSLKLAKTEARDLFRTRLLRRWSSLWHYLVTTDGWEAVFLLALYFVLRWNERLRGISVVMLASSAISLVVLLSFRQGARHFRFRILYDIARKSYSVGQYDFLFGPNSRLVGMDTSLLSCRSFRFMFCSFRSALRSRYGSTRHTMKQHTHSGKKSGPSVIIYWVRLFYGDCSLKRLQGMRQLALTSMESRAIKSRTEAAMIGLAFCFGQSVSLQFWLCYFFSLVL